MQMNYTTGKTTYNLQVRLAKKITALLCFFMVPIIAEGTKCKEVPDLKWASGSIGFMVNECFQSMNKISIQNWGAPVHPFLGMNQCSCVTDKIRRKFKCQEEYAKFVDDTGGGRILIEELSKSCILEGAMGEEAKKALMEENNSESKVEIKEPEETKTTEKMSWDELINK